MKDNFDIITVNAIANIINEYVDGAWDAMNEARDNWYNSAPDSTEERFYSAEMAVQDHTHSVLQEIAEQLDILIRAEELRIKYMS